MKQDTFSCCDDWISLFCRPQHTGFGKRLLAVAELISVANGHRKVAVIAGVGTRQYYRKFGYQIESHFMTKAISPSAVDRWLCEVGIDLPVNVQFYDVETDLGELTDDSNHTTASSQHAEMSATVKRNKGKRNTDAIGNGNNQRRDYQQKGKDRRRLKPDILTEVEGSCCSKIASYAKGKGRIFIDRIEKVAEQPDAAFRKVGLPGGAVGRSYVLSAAAAVLGFLAIAAIVWKRPRM